MTDEPARPLGEIIRAQRRIARMSLRQLAAVSAVSNPYLSQIERGVHEPSFRVLQSVADALDTSTEALLRQAGMLRDGDAGEGPGGRRDRAGAGGRAAGGAGAGGQGVDGPSDVERAVAADERLSPDQKAALAAIYRGYVREAGAGGIGRSRPPGGDTS